MKRPKPYPIQPRLRLVRDETRDQHRVCTCTPTIFTVGDEEGPGPVFWLHQPHCELPLEQHEVRAR